MEISLIIVSQKLFERKLVAYFLLDNSSKGFDAEHWWEIHSVAFLTQSLLAACLHARNEMGSFFFPLMANMLFVSMKLFLAGKGFREIFLPILNSVAYYPRLTNLLMCNICLHVLKFC